MPTLKAQIVGSAILEMVWNAIDSPKDEYLRLKMEGPPEVLPNFGRLFEESRYALVHGSKIEQQRARCARLDQWNWVNLDRTTVPNYMVVIDENVLSGPCHDRHFTFEKSIPASYESPNTVPAFADWELGAIDQKGPLSLIKWPAVAETKLTKESLDISAEPKRISTYRGFVHSVEGKMALISLTGEEGEILDGEYTLAELSKHEIREGTAFNCYLVELPNRGYDFEFEPIRDNTPSEAEQLALWERLKSLESGGQVELAL